MAGVGVKAGVEVEWGEVARSALLKEGPPLLPQTGPALSVAVPFWTEGRNSSHFHHGLDSLCGT